MMNIQQKRDLLMSLPLMEQEQRWIMERLDTLSVKEQYQLSAAILRTGKLEELAGIVKANSLCALGQTSANPVVSTLKHFRQEYIDHIVDRNCTAKVCKNLMQYHIRRDACAGCGLCAKNCPADAIIRTDYTAPGKRLPAMEIVAAKCVKCGACMAGCKFHAIEKI